MQLVNLEAYMQRCIELAQKGAGYVSPNPMVGAVIVHQDRIIGEGYHEQYGQAHAEVNAIHSVLNTYGESAVELLSQSTIFVSLEPCAHFGKTPPCADLIIRYSIPRVVIGSPDPFNAVNGQGIKKLKDAGVLVTENVLRNECDFLNRRFLTRVKEQRPYIILKWAQTADNYFAPEGGQQWISSKTAKVLSHKWRSEEDAILIGKNTALTDNPQLNVREWTGRNPKRIVIDRNLELPHHLNIFDKSQDTIIFNSLKTDIDQNLKYLELEDFDHYLPQLICYQLYLMDIQSLIVEGGAKTLELFIKAGLWDEARIFTSSDNWCKGIKAPQCSGSLLETTKVASDTLNVFLKKL